MDGTKKTVRNVGTKNPKQTIETKGQTSKKEWYKMTVRKELVSWCFEPSQPHRVVAYLTKHILVVQKDCTERYPQYRQKVWKGGAKRQTDTSCTI